VVSVGAEKAVGMTAGCVVLLEASFTTGLIGLKYRQLSWQAMKLWRMWISLQAA